MSGSVAEPGRYAVVRAWVPPWPHEASPARVWEYVRMPDHDDGEDYWIPICGDGLSWDQVIRNAVKIEVVRGGVETEPQSTDQERE